jgi:hypothetical protein
MYSIYVDDIRNPQEKFDVVCRTTNDTIKAFRKKYKEGTRHFFIDMDHDAGENAAGGDFINILKTIESYVYMGKMKDLDIDVRFHSGNTVGIDNMRQIVQHNDFMYEVM